MSHSKREIAHHGPTTSTSNTGTLLTFAHGAKGSMHAPEVTNFRDGFARHLPVVTFNSRGPLDARTSHYLDVLGNISYSDPPKEVVLGGRSLGARAAVEIANRRHEGKDAYRRLVLVSYALHRVVDVGGGVEGEEVRDRPLLELGEGVEVLFIIGSRDQLCELGRLEEMRKGMKCRTWVCRVDGADHMMKFAGDGKAEVEEWVTRVMGERMGELAADWIKGGGGLGGQNGVLSWDQGKQSPVWSGWH